MTSHTHATERNRHYLSPHRDGKPYFLHQYTYDPGQPLGTQSQSSTSSHLVATVHCTMKGCGKVLQSGRNSSPSSTIFGVMYFIILVLP